jgi:Ankyrin repeats (3 copies)
VAASRTQSIIFALLGLNRAGKILYTVLFVLAVPALAAWFVWLPRLRFSDEDERLFRAARHGDRAGVERSLGAGAKVSDVSPIDGKTALFRAAVFGHADVVRLLLERGADPAARGSDGRSALEVIQAAREEEKDRTRQQALDAVAVVLRGGEAR